MRFVLDHLDALFPVVLTLYSYGVVHMSVTCRRSFAECSKLVEAHYED